MVVVLDCNIWISLTLNSQLKFIADLSDSGIVVASCHELRSEITNVLYRPKFNKLISYSDIDKVIKFHDLVTKSYYPGKILKVTSDEKDDYLFALAAKSKANYLITGDKLLLNVVKYKNTQIVTLAEFKQSTKNW